MAAQERTKVSGAAIGVLVVVGALFVLVGWSAISSSFGDSDEGINGSVWSYNSRSLREAGVGASALGGRRLDGTDYATHPPLIVVETALAERLFGEREWVSRSAAWIGSLVSIALLYRLSRSLGVDPLSAAAATAATVLTPMLFVYGSMLDTPVTAFPFGLGVALLWHRDWRASDRGRADQPQPARWWASGLVSLLACLAGWQCGLLVGLGAGALVVRALRRRDGAWRAAIPYVVGGSAGIALSVGWGLWSYGSLSALADKFTRRSGASGGVSPIDVVTFQIPWLFQLLGLAFFGLIGCALALRDRRYRPLAALSLSVVAIYSLLFREAAAGHQYWMYWALFPTVVGLTYIVESLRRVARNLGAAPTTAAVAVLGLAVVVGLVDVERGSEAQVLISEGRQPVDLVRAARLPPGDAVYYVGQRFRPDSWILYYTNRHGQFLASPDELARLARDQPDTPVLVLGVCDPSDPSYTFCTRVTGPPHEDGRPERMVTAAQLAAEVGVEPAAPVSAGGPPPLPPPARSAP